MRANSVGRRVQEVVPSTHAWFEEFEQKGLSRVRVALATTFGAELGGEAAAEVVRYAWEHRERLASMENPAGYLYRVGQTSIRQQLRWRRAPLPVEVSASFEDRVDPDLPQALALLSTRQRMAVVLVHVNGWTYEEAGVAMGVDVSTVRTHVARALARLRDLLEERD